MFYDITNIQFEGEGCKIGRIGHPKLGKRNHKQVLLGVVMVEGLPVAHYVFRGNRGEKTTLKWIKKKIKEKYNISRIVIVADRGMISTSNLEDIEKSDGYIVATKRRRDEEAKILLDSDDEGYLQIKDNLKAKEVKIKEDGKRRIICINKERAKEDREKREAIIEELEEELAELEDDKSSNKIKKGREKAIISRCEKILSKRHGRRYFNYEIKDGKLEFSRNQENIKYEEKLDGRFMIKTTESKLSVKDIVLNYKDLMYIEDAFRDLKDFINIAPVYHQLSTRTKAHIFVCILTLFISRYMEKKLIQAGLDISLPKALSRLKIIRIVVNQIKNRYLKFVVVPPQELYRVLRAFGISKLPKLLPDVGCGTVTPDLPADILN